MLLVALLITTAFGTAAGQTPSPSRLKTSVFGSAGSPVGGSGSRLNGTLGQPSVIGRTSGTAGAAFLGFWYGRVAVMPTDAEVTPPARDRLYQNYPNPFNPVTTIAFSLESGGHAELAIYNANGQQVRVLVDGHRQQGRQTVSWDGRNDAGRPVSSGIYFYRLRTVSFESVRKMVLLR
jgi:hypothetical protein